MSEKTQKNWRELCLDLHNEQESGNLTDVLSELNGELDQQVVEVTPSAGLSTSPTSFDPVVQAIPLVATDRTNS